MICTCVVRRWEFQSGKLDEAYCTLGCDSLPQAGFVVCIVKEEIITIPLKVAAGSNPHDSFTVDSRIKVVGTLGHGETSFAMKLSRCVRILLLDAGLDGISRYLRRVCNACSQPGTERGVWLVPHIIPACQVRLQDILNEIERGELWMGEPMTAYGDFASEVHGVPRPIAYTCRCIVKGELCQRGHGRK